MSQSTYSELLKSATVSQSLPLGRQVHAQILKALLAPCTFLLSNLLNMYCKCGDMTAAHQLFDRIPMKDIVPWNMLIAGYCQAGLDHKSMDIFNNARRAQGKLDRYTYASALSVCSRTGNLNKGRVIHGMAIVDGFYRHAFLTNSLIDMYSKCGSTIEARHVFDSATEVDDVSWNSMVSAYVRNCLADETLSIFTQMRKLGVKVNPFVLGSLLKSCSTVGDAVMVHGCLVKVGLESNVFVGSVLIDLYARNGCLDGAVKLFEMIPDPNVVVFNSMIAGFSRLDTYKENEDNCQKALDLFHKMQRRGMKPSPFTFSSVLRACNLGNRLQLAKQIHGQVLKYDLRHDEFIGSALIDIYSVEISVEEGLKCFHFLPRQDIVTWTSMISGCVQTENYENALSLFHDLLCVGIKPDQFTLSCLMSACANLAVARCGEQIQCYTTKAGFCWFPIIGNSQIFMYARSGDVDAANQTFREMEHRDVVSWSAVISSHAQYGCAKDAIILFKEMETTKVLPNHVTFLGVLTACSHGGSIDEGFRYYERMKRDYNLDPNVKHCACIVDLLGRAGKLADAEKFIIDSGFYDDPVIWRALLASCRIHKDIVRGTHVAERIMELEPHASASYVLLYNMYLDAGKKSLAIRTRDFMKERGVKKEPGLSWIEIGASVHSFVVGDNSHPDSNAIYAKLEEMRLKIKKMGYGKLEPLEVDINEQNQNFMNCHSEKLAVAFGMIHLPNLAPIRVMKNLRVCVDCHTTMKFFSTSERREIVLRDPIRFHRFRNGSCSCGDYW